MLTAAFRDTRGEVTRGFERDFHALNGAYFSRPMRAEMLTGPMAAGDYELGFCFNDRETEARYEVTGQGIVVVLPSSVAE